MEWTWLTGVAPECSALALIIGFLLWLLRRETKDRDYWRNLAIDALRLGEEVVETARDLLGEPPND